MLPIKAPAYIGANLRDGGFYAVKERSEDSWYARLSRIADSLPQACEVHGFACRDEISLNTISVEDLYREANNYPGRAME